MSKDRSSFALDKKSHGPIFHVSERGHVGDKRDVWWPWTP